MRRSVSNFYSRLLSIAFEAWVSEPTPTILFLFQVTCFVFMVLRSLTTSATFSLHFKAFEFTAVREIRV
jgi:hypothetical protein